MPNEDSLSTKLTNEQLRKLLDIYLKEGIPESQWEWINRHRARVQQTKEDLFNVELLKRATDEELRRDLIEYYGSVVRRPMYRRSIEQNVDKFRAGLLYLLESEDSLQTKVDEVLDQNGRYRVVGISKAFWSTFFQPLDPSQNPRWNPKAELGLENLGMRYWSSGDSPGQVYAALQRAQLALVGLREDLDLFLIDHFMHYVTVEDGKDILDEWLGVEGPSTETVARYWKIAPGKGAWNWDACREGGFIAIGWDDLGDISDLSRAEFNALGDRLVAQYDDWTKTGLDQVWTFARVIKEGDRIVANRGTTRVLGIGTVIGSYHFVEGQRHGHRLPVKWDDLTTRQVRKAGWRRTLVSLSEEEFDEISHEPPVKPKVDPGSPFSEATFEILAQLHGEPTYDFYTAHKDALWTHVVEPFKKVMMIVQEKLPSPIHEKLETEKRVFASILKQFAKQGCWDFYWGAFYPKGGKRTHDAQLFSWINRDHLEFGFYIGEYGSDQRNRFLRNCRQNYEGLVRVLRDSLANTTIQFGEHTDTIGGSEGFDDARKTWPSFEDWLKDPSETDVHAAVLLPKEEVLRRSLGQLADEIAEVHQRLFPLVLLATLDNPMPAIGNYLGDRGVLEINPEYSLEKCAENTYFDSAVLKRWVRAIERKGQAVLYGPPGTGKTYLAEHLARHLIGGGDGFCDIVQFHPAYAYEDFVQGIRPKPNADGQLDFPVVPGRVLEFCEKARACQGRCVLIIDEINRAKLAQVFGELMYLLEYRDREVPLASGGSLRIPSNVRIIGTMNTADRSIALVDHALRRRFAFLALYPNYDVLRRYHQGTGFDVEPLIAVLHKLNRQIGDRHYEVGITFFLREDLAEQIEDIWRMEIEPYLEEYFFDQPDKVDALRWDRVAQEVLPQ